MLSIEPIKTGRYAEYILNSVALFEKDRKRTDYYFKDEASVIPFENSFRMSGEGARAFGIHGLDFSKKENREVFLNLFHGLDPRDGGKTKLVSNAKERKKTFFEDDKDKAFRRVGYDCVFRSCKELSAAIGWARITQDKELEAKLVDIHRQSVAYALQEMEKNLVARSGPQGVIKETGVKAFISQVDHLDTRPVKLLDENGQEILDEKGEAKTATDMQMHTHAILNNFAICKNGKVRCLDGLSVVQQVHLGTSLYRQKQAELLQQHGFSLTSQRKHDDYGPTQVMKFGLNGISDEVKQEFSHRTDEIHDYMEENGVSAQTAAMLTRNDKELNYDELEVEWKERFDALIANDINCIQLEPGQFENQLDPVPDDEEILNLVHKFKHRVAITEMDIETVIRQSLAGHDNSIERTNETLKRIMNNPELICSLKDKDELGKPQFVSMKLVQADLQIRSYVAATANSHEHDIDPAIVEKAIVDFDREKSIELKKPIKLSKEQRNAIKTACQGGLTSIAGWAGTGKSFSSAVISTIYQSQGYSVKGYSTANLASLNLQEEAKIEGSSIAKMFYDYDAGKVKFDSKSVLLIDESGMLSLEMGAKLISIAEETGAKIIMCGDSRQLSPPGTGGNCLKVIEQCIAPNNMATLKDIQRQKNQRDKDIAVEFYNMKTKEDSLRQYATLEEYGYVGVTTDIDEAVAKIAEEYVNHPADAKDKLVMASMNETVVQLNRAIQAKYLNRGEIGKDVIRKIGMYQFHEGSPVRFTNSKRFSKDVMAVNGTQGVVVASTDGSLQVRLESGAVVTIPDDFKSLDLNYASTCHKSQGQSDLAVWVAIDSESFKSSLSLVSFTRMKAEIKLYGDQDCMTGLSQQMHIIDSEAGAFERLSDESKKQFLRGKGLTECQTKDKIFQAEVANLKKFMKEDDKKENILTSLAPASRKHLREKWQLTFRHQLKKNQSLTIPQLQKETTEEHAMNNQEVDTEIQEALTLDTNPAPELINKKKAAEQGPFPWSPSTNYKFLNEVLEHYDLRVEDDKEGGYGILSGKVYSAHIKKDRSIDFSEKSLVQNHVYDIATKMAKSNHFDPSKPINISVSETLANFSEEKQAAAIRKMIEALQRGGIEIDMITITNEKHRNILEEYRTAKAEDAITLDQSAAPGPAVASTATAEEEATQDNATEAAASNRRSPLNSVEDAKAEGLINANDALYGNNRGGMEGLDVNKATASMQKTSANRPRKTMEELQAEQDAKDIEKARRIMQERMSQGQTYDDAPATQEEVVKARKKTKLGM